MSAHSETLGQFRQEFDRDLGHLKDCICWGERDIGKFNGSIREKASRRIDSRREKLLYDRKIVEGFGVSAQTKGGCAYYVHNAKGETANPPIQGCQPRQGH